MTEDQRAIVERLIGDLEAAAMLIAHESHGLCDTAKYFATIKAARVVFPARKTLQPGGEVVAT